MKLSNRLNKVPAYMFTKLNQLKTELLKKGIDIIDLSIGDPDIPPPACVMDSFKKAAEQRENQMYPPSSGVAEFKKSIAEYYKRTYNIELDTDSEIAALIGSKEGIAHLFLALTDVNDYVLIPDPGYPVYYSAAVIAGCIPYTMLLSEKNGYMPKIDNIYPEVSKKAKLMIVNYPNNPTGAAATIDFYNELVKYGRDNNIIIVNDGAYNEFCLDRSCRTSILQAENAKTNCIEFGTLSKSYSMTGWRLGYVVGNRDVIERLMIVKNNFDSGQFAAIQYAGSDVIDSSDGYIENANSIYNSRREKVNKALKKAGLHVYDSIGTFYVWFRIPPNYKSQEFSEYVLQKTGIMITPGNAFGHNGEGYCRISLTASSDKIENAAEKIEELVF